MMQEINLKISKGDQSKVVKATLGEKLLNVMQREGFEMLVPCGGNGVCGKCQVRIKGEGNVLACHHLVRASDAEIILPGERESRILVEQSKNTVELRCDPGTFDHLSQNPHGIAVDVGTTSVVIYLLNLITLELIETRSFLNPQGVYGADVISRIQYCMENENGVHVLQTTLINRINDSLDSLLASQKLKNRDIVKATFAGNTTMQHLVLGENPQGIAYAPFEPVFTEQKNVKGEFLNLHCHPEAEVLVLPSLSGYVGADITAGLSTLKDIGKLNALFIDVGTNGEMALLTPDTIYACSSAAGPAFEGANISCGLGSVEGAISAFEQNKIETIGNADPKGICGSGLIDIVAHVINDGTSDLTGYMKEPFVVSGKGSDDEISLSPKDMREVQMAKGAIAAGIQIMLTEADLKESDVDVLYLAGGFGNHINIKNAVRIGLFPSSMEEKIIPIGNAAGTGALLALKSKEFEKRIQDVIRKMKYIELSSRTDFNMEYVANMEFTAD